MYQVYDNIFTEDEQELLKNIFFDNDFPYYDTSNQKTVTDSQLDQWADENTVEARCIGHGFILNGEVSSYYQKIEHILQKFYEKTRIKFSGIIRCKLNLQYQVADYNSNHYQCPHIDQYFEHKVLIYYPYTTDGDTFLFEEIKPKNYKIVDRIQPIGGRFLLMDKMFHAGQPPILNETRMSLNYNLMA
tara:strand:- start:43 stop:606 length:564 start_codon:yes stop_codon:yes gene_type:complete